jgi:hypothetical protein
MTRRTRALCLVSTLALATLLPVATVQAGSPTKCRVRDVESGVTKGSLAAAIAAADPGDHLRLRGTCHGLVTIDRDLTIKGLAGSSSGIPTIDGDSLGTVVTVAGGLTVVITDLTIRDGMSAAGGGIRTQATNLTLRRVTVRDSRAPNGQGGGIHVVSGGALSLYDSVVRDNRAGGGEGGGIYNGGAASLFTTSVLQANRALRGGGVFNDAAFSFFGSSLAVDNRANDAGGGAYNDGAMSLFESSTVLRNHAANQGGGVFDAGAFSVFDAATIRRNTSGLPGGAGGLYETTTTARGGVTIASIICGPAPGANVRKNTPVNCIFET